MHRIGMATTEQVHTEDKPAPGREAPRVRGRIAGFVAVVQLILLAAHFFVGETWAFFAPPAGAHGMLLLRIGTLLLAVSFIGASLLAWRYWNWAVRGFYRLTAIWLGALNFFFLAACVCWPALAVARLAGWHGPRSLIAEALFGLALLVAAYGVVNAHWVRVKRVPVKLPNLPESWRGRVAAVVSDVHLGHVNGAGFLRGILRKLRRARPDVVFAPGDLFDGTAADYDALVAPWKEFTDAKEAPLGVYFVTGNHEEFSDRGKYLRAVERVGMRVLQNEKVMLDGLQLVGVHDDESANDARLARILEAARVDRGRASVLLLHVPRGLRVSEVAGISLQISGHTHGGQIFPFTWFTRRIFREFTHGLARIGGMAVYTSYGAGTWGPPLRVGTWPEIVLLEFV